jgi:hypothetical protein
METAMRNRKLILAAALGATGGLIVIAISRVILPRMMAGMMKKMMLRMKKEGCNPAEI